MKSWRMQSQVGTHPDMTLHHARTKNKKQKNDVSKLKDMRVHPHIWLDPHTKRTDHVHIDITE